MRSRANKNKNDCALADGFFFLYTGVSKQKEINLCCSGCTYPPTGYMLWVFAFYSSVITATATEYTTAGAANANCCEHY
jgi:hypothetical protein